MTKYRPLRCGSFSGLFVSYSLVTCMFPPVLRRSKEKKNPAKSRFDGVLFIRFYFSLKVKTYLMPTYNAARKTNDTALSAKVQEVYDFGLVSYLFVTSAF